MKIKKNLLAAVVFFTSLIMATLPSLAQQTTQAVASESVIESIKERGVIKIGLSLFYPWAMRDKNGDLIGFELDVGNKLAEDMGVEAEFIPTAWDGIIPALIAGKFDVIISGMSVTPTRNLTVNFSEPYAYSGQTIIANKSMTEGFELDDYNSPEVTFSARRGASPATVISEMFPEAQLLLFDEDGASTQEVLNGNAHATMAAEPTPSIEARKYSDTLHVPFKQAFLATGEAFAYRKGDPDATNFFNNWIHINWQNGFLQQRNDYWFRSNEWEDLVDQ